MAPSGAEVYVDDERYGSVGRSGRVILTSIAPGQHVLRVSKAGEPDDERVIEIRSDIAEQIIEAQLKIGVSSNQLTPSRGGSLDSKHGGTLHHVVGRDVYEVPFAFCGGREVLRQVWQHDFSTGRGGSAMSRAAVTIMPRARSFAGAAAMPIGTASLDWRPPKPVEVFCSGCSSSYPAGTKFCGRCGKPIRARRLSPFR